MNPAKIEAGRIASILVRMLEKMPQETPRQRQALNYWEQTRKRKPVK